MELRINGKTNELPDGATVIDAIRRAGVDLNASGVAAALNDTVVPREAWANTELKHGDFVEIIRAVAGG